MSYLDWKVGDKVVCIDDTPIIGRALLELHRVYTITGISCANGMFNDEFVFDEVVIALAEAKSIRLSGKTHDRGFSARRFRPVTKRATDISIFTAMLDPTRKHSPEDIEFARQLNEEIEDAAEFNAALKFGRLP